MDGTTPIGFSACPHDCPSTCALEVELEGPDRIGRVYGAKANTYTDGVICAKVARYAERVHHPDRLTRPQVRRYLLEGGKKGQDPKGNEMVEADWDTALDIAANRLRETRDAHGSDSVGLLTSAKCLNEENYLMNKLARQEFGTNNIDHCARL